MTLEREVSAAVGSVFVESQVKITTNSPKQHNLTSFQTSQLRSLCFLNSTLEFHGLTPPSPPVPRRPPPTSQGIIPTPPPHFFVYFPSVATTSCLIFLFTLDAVSYGQGRIQIRPFVCHTISSVTRKSTRSRCRSLNHLMQIPQATVQINLSLVKRSSQRTIANSCSAELNHRLLAPPLWRYGPPRQGRRQPSLTRPPP